jgi:hypothetical protein
MICPNCESEYREGFTRCSECNVDLIDPESANGIEDPSNNELTRIFDTQKHDLLIEITMALENHGIPYLAQSGTAFDATGVVEQNQGLTWRGALWVPESFEDDAELIIEEVKTQLAKSEHVEPEE